MSSSFLQTLSWLKFQESLGHKTWRFESAGISATVIEHRLPFKRCYLYIPHGPIVMLEGISGGLKNEVKRFLTEVRTLAQRQGAMFVKIEPLLDAVTEILFQVTSDLKRSEREVQPARSVVIDLAPSEADLLAAMHHKTRYNISVAQRHELVVRQSEDINSFCRLLVKTSARDKFYAHDQNHYRKLLEMFRDTTGELVSRLFLAFQGDQPVAGAIILEHAGTAYYLHGASDYEHRSLMGPYLLHWEIIKWARSRGLRSYDLWGIDAQRWPGVTRFKLGWGGQVVERPDSFDMVISPFWYLVYGFWRRLRGK